jgi:hypothetical protein
MKQPEPQMNAATAKLIKDAIGMLPSNRKKPEIKEVGANARTEDLVQAAIALLPPSRRKPA